MMCQELAYTKIVICMQFLELLKTELYSIVSNAVLVLTS